MASTTTTPPTPAPSLQEATKASTAVWQQDLESLFHHAKDRFPDVVWELDQDEEVYGHKAIVYARAPPSFQNRYFARGGESTAALVYSEDGYPAESTLTLADPTPQQQQQQPAGPPAPTLLRLTSDISPALFANELEYLYTGKGFGEAFEFLFDAEHTHTHTHSGGGGSTASIVSADEPEHAEALRIDKLRKDLVFMWRSRLYSDVRIALTGNFSAGAGHEATTAIFSSHRFVLVSRSSYFYDALLAWPRPPSSSSPSYALSSSVSSAGGPGEQPTLTLPSPPFTPASVHFTLGFLYTGTLIFSHRSYDLSTAFAILRAALYLGIPTLHDEIQARIAAEMLHGLFHAFLPFPAYEALTQGRWGTGGCRCRQCARRAPRVLELAVAPDVQNAVLERGARRALVGLFGEGWATQEFAQLPQKLRESLLKGVAKRTTGENALGLLYAAEHALRRLGSAVEPWADVVRDAVLTARGKVDEVVAREAEVVFATDEWEAVLEGGGDHFEDSERVEWTMASVLRGVRDDCAPVLYQTLVSSILLRPHPTEPSAPLLPATSNIRVQVEQTRMELLKWFGKNWLNVRQARGFDPLEGWSLKEISDHIEVSIDDLLSPPSYSSPAKRSQAHLHPHSRPTSTHPHPHTSRADVASESASMRVSVLSRVAGSAAGASQRGSGAASPRHTNNNNNNALSSGRGSSVYSLARSTASSVSVRSAATASTISAMPRVHSPVGAGAEGERMSPARRIAEDARRSMARSLSEKERPDSKFVDDEIVGGVQAPSIVLPPGEAEAEVGVDEEASGFGDEASEGGDGEDEEGGDEGDGQSDAASTAMSTGPGGTRPLVVGPKKTVVSRASSRASMASTTPSRRTPVAATGPKKTSPSAQRIKGEEREGVRTRTTSAASSVSLSPSVRAKTATGSPARGSTTTKGRLSVKTTTKAGAAGITSPRAPPRTPSTATLSRPTSRVSTHSTRSVSGGAARPESSASGTGTSDSYRTASAGSASSPVSTRKSVSTAGTRSRTTSTASTSTMSTLSRRTVSTATASTTSGSGPATPASRGAPRLSAGSAAADRKRRVSGASVASSVSVASASPSTRSTAPRATPVRKTVSAGAEKDKQHLSPAAAVAAKAKGKAPVGGTPKKVGSSASVGAVPSPGSGPVARTRKITGKKEKEPEPEPDAESSDTGEGEGDETVVMAAPPVLDADDQDNTITLPPPEVDKENQTPATSTAVVEDNDKDTKLAGDEPSPAKTTTSTSTITVRPGMRDLARVGGDTEHKKTASSASSSSVSTLRRKGSNDTIRTVKSSGLASVSTPSSQAQALPAQSSPAPAPAPAPAPTTVQPPPAQTPAQAHTSPSARPASPPAVATAARHPTSIDHILAQTAPQGATLEIGIPCIISSKRKRFKAYARYIGEVLGESGPWVGVEVPLPLGDAAWAWGDESFVSSGSMAHSQHMAGSGYMGPRDDRAWHDGSWGGVRYFEIGGGVGGSEWEYGYAGGESDRAARRRRLEGGGSWWSSGGGGASGVGGAGSGSGIGAGGGTKREGDSLSIASERMKRMRSVSPAHSDVSGGTESRGLFVRPQQVLYVVDAVGADF